VQVVESFNWRETQLEAAVILFHRLHDLDNAGSVLGFRKLRKPSLNVAELH
jgi:hypothetical protein